MTEQLPTELRRSSRDPEALRARLEAWLQRRHPGAQVTALNSTSATGMSSDTLLFDATWDGTATSLVARVAPDAADVPVFPGYDLTRQANLIRLVGERTAVPVPEVLWDEPDPDPLGMPFF